MSKPQKSCADLVKDYSEALIWAGLNLLFRRDAVRKADAEAMIAFLCQQTSKIYNSNTSTPLSSLWLDAGRGEVRPDP